MDKDELFFNNLVKILTEFKNKPWYLSKFLIKNNAFNESFIKRIIKSDISNTKKLEDIKFYDIDHMNDYFNSLIEDIPFIEDKTKEDLNIEFNKKLNKLLEDERYEDAMKIRDYMIKNNIKIN